MHYSVTDLFRTTCYAARAAASICLGPFVSVGHDITTRDSSVDIETVAREPSTVEYGWIPCDSCGAWVGTELISPDGAGYTEDDAFNCSSCRWGDDEDI